MVKIHKRGRFDEPFEIGREELIEIINRRLKDTGTKIGDVFEADALEYLLKYSGGHIRSLIRFVQEAIIEIDDLPIDYAAARKSVREEVRGFGASVREEYWSKLAELELSENQQIKMATMIIPECLKASLFSNTKTATKWNETIIIGMPSILQFV